MERRLLIILGPTAVGKTDLSIGKALEYGSPVISCDSRQIFKDMTIGTAVPDASQLAAVKHYFIQTVPLTEVYTAGDYEQDAITLIEKLFDEGHETLVMTGGSMFYIDAVCKGLDDLPDGEPGLRKELWNRLAEEGVDVLAEELRLKDPLTYSRIDVKNSQRVIRALEVCLLTGKPFSSYKTGVLRTRPFIIEKVGLQRPREELYSRINRRVLDMIDAGLEDEVRTLIPYRDCQALQTVGYKEMFKYIDGECSLDEAVRMIQLNTRHYAKRQLTWWRRDPDIRWIDL
ncbi:MAG: tRNA (adenosine(37)-N6)-dimethylallyltransferase MiaA [Bacteroidales bacterium]|jgi:tRNA dimethylallyltransferase|nr:tRNA (adenosine(37)-N6)-dimethylallyltransferase MiaA [Bacteroidales bacterium]MEE3476037.1 tRNA (adenosine(37)-N6)-dimethylallyltransferase MiaA [Candidatus Cryptobacteroides sp.]MBQ5410584.1 tRNA (adenosine(37)-N6)-dimethylallyltransferase MiaA [Bacteroidales bacterium]MBQ6302254.1 tRNA (adenosine(37)-N6)-dimethylallyltransferase MiaA [Bacteroidales bacterium]MBR5398036.1 tRNA (adenosine(37)-N6)-dimethylallyltransferase MiaA [Bacteroidales bacterium]